MPFWAWIPFVVLLAIALLLGVFVLLGRVKGGKYLRPVVTFLSKVPLFKKWFQKASLAALERENPELAAAMRKMTTFGEPKTPEQAQRWGGTPGQPDDHCYHQACDRIDNIDRTALDRNVDAVAGAVARFALSTDGIPR